MFPLLVSPRLIVVVIPVVPVAGSYCPMNLENLEIIGFFVLGMFDHWK